MYKRTELDADRLIDRSVLRAENRGSLVDFDTTVSLRASLSCGRYDGRYCTRTRISGSFLNRARERLAFRWRALLTRQRSASLRKKRNRQQLPPSEAKKFRPRRYHGPSRSCSLSLFLIEKLDESCRRQEARSPRQKNGIFLPPSRRNCGRARLGPRRARFYERVAPHRRIGEEDARPSSRCVASKILGNAASHGIGACAPFLRNSSPSPSPSPSLALGSSSGLVRGGRLIVAGALRGKLRRARRLGASLAAGVPLK